MADFKVFPFDQDFKAVAQQLPGESAETKAEYPNDWFVDHPDSKPMFNFSPVSDDYDGLCKKINCVEKLPTINTICAYLHEFMVRNIKEKLQEDWESYGRAIGKKGDNITPLSLLSVSKGVKIDGVQDGEAPNEEEQSQLFTMYMCCYRFGIASDTKQDAYVDLVKQKMLQILRAAPYNLADFNDTILIESLTWFNDSNYRCLIAAFDMFMNKFPNNKWAKLRVSTLPSRFKDCSVLSDIKHFADTLNLPRKDAFQYIFMERIKDEVDRIAKGGEEFSNRNSYFPYMRDMSLTQKSPYSSGINPQMHNYFHFVAFLLGSNRSERSKIFAEEGLANSLNIAIFVAYTFKKYVQAKPVYGDGAGADKTAKALFELANKISEDADQDDEDEELEEGAQPEIKVKIGSALHVYKIMIQNKFEVPEAYRKVFRDTIKSSKAVMRPNSVGEYVLKNI